MADQCTVAFDKSSIFDTSINDEIYKDWRPPGVLYKTLDAEDKTIEIWKGNLSDKAIQQLIKRIQILIPLFIEGGQAINLNDPDWSLRRWTVFVLYQKRSNVEDSSASPYIFMGYSTVYRYFHYPLPTPPSSPVSKKLPNSDPTNAQPFQFPIPEESSFELPCRSRISQFLILPPFQGSGNGSRFYEAIFNFYLNHPQTVEITVEDPNEAFDDLRDVNDLERLRKISEFTSLKIKTDVSVSKKGRVPTGKIVDLAAIEALRQKMKIAPRQFMRLVEMQLLTLIPTYIRKSLILEKKQGTAAEIKTREHEYHLWQLFVKQRLYRHNKDTLIQLDRAERIDKLEDAADNVEADYGRLLRMVEQRGKRTVGPAGSIRKVRNGKRAVETDDHDDEIEGEPSIKKVRITEE